MITVFVKGINSFGSGGAPAAPVSAAQNAANSYVFEYAAQAATLFNFAAMFADARAAGFQVPLLTDCYQLCRCFVTLAGAGQSTCTAGLRDGGGARVTRDFEMFGTSPPGVRDMLFFPGSLLALADDGGDADRPMYAELIPIREPRDAVRSSCCASPALLGA